MGLPGLETLLPLTYTRGVLEGRLTLEEMCVKLSTNPAKIMGLYPRKGAIQVGADADIAIIHPATRHAVIPAKMETNADWSPYEGWDLAGFSRTCLATQNVSSGLASCPAASRSTIASASSHSASNLHPLSLRNCNIAAVAARLFPSSNG